jgi:hypothetical protein
MQKCYTFSYSIVESRRLVSLPGAYETQLFLSLVLIFCNSYAVTACQETRR